MSGCLSLRHLSTSFLEPDRSGINYLMTVILRQACIEDYPAIGYFIREAWGPLAVRRAISPGPPRCGSQIITIGAATFEYGD